MIRFFVARRNIVVFIMCFAAVAHDDTRTRQYWGLIIYYRTR